MVTNAPKFRVGAGAAKGDDDSSLTKRVSEAIDSTLFERRSDVDDSGEKESMFMLLQQWKRTVETSRAGLLHLTKQFDYLEVQLMILKHGSRQHISKGILVTIMAMHEHSEVASIQLHGCRVIRLLSDSQFCKVLDRRCIECIAVAMQSFVGPVDIQIEGCKFFTNCAAILERRSDFKKAWQIHGEGKYLVDVAVNAGMTALEAHSSDLIVCRSLVNEIQVFAPLAVTQIFALMQKHPDKPRVQHITCALVFHAVSKDLGSQELFIALGGVPLLLSAMQMYKICPNVQFSALRVLAELAIMEDNQKTFKAAHGIKTVVGSMKAHSQVDLVQYFGIKVLRLLLNPSDETQILHTGVIDTVLASMMGHLHNSLVQAFGIDIFAKQSASSDKTCQDIVAKGGTEAILMSMGSQVADCGVQESGCNAINIIVGRSRDAKQAGRRGGIDALLTAMRTHPVAHQINSCACRALKEIAESNVDNRRTVIAQGAIPLLKQPPHSDFMIAKTLLFVLEERHLAAFCSHLWGRYAEKK